MVSIALKVASARAGSNPKILKKSAYSFAEMFPSLSESTAWKKRGRGPETVAFNVGSCTNFFMDSMKASRAMESPPPTVERYLSQT